MNLTFFMEESEKKEIRISINKKRYSELKEEAKKLSIPVSSLVKIKIGV